MGEEIDERAGGRFYGIALGIDSVRLDGSQVPGGRNADLAIKWRYRDPTRRITFDFRDLRPGNPRPRLSVVAPAPLGVRFLFRVTLRRHDQNSSVPIRPIGYERLLAKPPVIAPRRWSARSRGYWG